MAKEIPCPLCPKVFLAPSKLRRHMLVHRDEKPYMCEQCDKTFSLANHIKLNMRVHAHVHSGEKPYKCKQCGKSFSQVCDLKKHILVHSGDKFHLCVQCGKSFK